MTEFTNFEDIKISTQTIIGISNVDINIEKLFHKFQIHPYTVIEKRRGRKRKNDVEKKPEILPDGSIITVKYGDTIRGVDTKQKKKHGKFFRNALTIVMFMGGKQINFKISKNGNFQFTGCKDNRHAVECIKYMWNQIHIDDYNLKLYDNEPLYTLKNGHQQFTIKFLTVMANIDFNIGFPINREKLDLFVNSNTHYNSLLETSFGYTGVNIKIKVQTPFDFDITCLEYNLKQKIWNEYQLSYFKFIESDTCYQKYKTKYRYNTFLVFHSGNIIMSGFNPKYMKDCYQEFRKLLVDNRLAIEEKIKTK